MICYNCNGSGEGQHDGTLCYICKGAGTLPDTDTDPDTNDFEEITDDTAN